jgi:hypothetical protein
MPSAPLITVNTRRSVQPQAIVKATVPKELRPQFLKQLESFAGANGFRISIRQLIAPVEIKGPRDWTIVNMKREDVVVMGSNIEDNSVFSFDFFSALGRTASPEVVDRLVTDLNAQVARIPGLASVREQ